ncbi:M20 metallopeptidase family protein [Candidatus Microthrix parvicella]|jgi:amidohydrolase|uniref:M20 metallopeptidase family protein n=1 Tax=Candidatus Neomicrothrix parvicella TaxID=41950 RepID=UPI0003735E6C|nr:M20 family metallopeptidase [Candidatus Microthrix parvicella]
MGDPTQTGATSDINNGPLAELAAEANGFVDDLVAWRRDIHANPELGLDNPRTRDLIIEALAPLSLPIRTGEQASWVAADIVGDPDGPTILLRADTDALPMTENSDESFSSVVKGRAHTCGHDGHVAMLLGAARLLSTRRNDLPGTVRLVFQPGEEGHAGAQVMLTEGVLTDGLTNPVTGSFAMHVTPNIPTGFMGTKAGALMASADEFSVTIRGRGTHASTPHFGVDPMPAAAELVGALNSMITRRIEAFDPAILTVAHLTGGTTHNVIPERVLMEGTVRCVSDHTRSRVEQLFAEVVNGVTAAHGCTAEIEYHRGYPVTVNDAAMTALVGDVCHAVIGSDTMFPLPSPVMGAEDYSYVLQQVPGAMAFLGVCPADIENFFEAPSCHSDVMRLNEDALPLGAAMHAGVAIEWLTRNT